jgi:hypothetical protein
MIKELTDILRNSPTWTKYKPQHIRVTCPILSVVVIGASITHTFGMDNRFGALIESASS